MGRSQRNFLVSIPHPIDIRISLSNMPVQILDTALSAVGHTPLIRLDKIAKAQGLKCNLRTFISFLAALSVSEVS